MTTPTLADIDIYRTREIGETIRDLEVGDRIHVTNNRIDYYVRGEVYRTAVEYGLYFAYIESEETDSRWELHANWVDVPRDSSDLETPYTGLLEEPWDDTSPEVTDIEVIEDY